MSEPHFTIDMTIAQAMAVNPQVSQVFAAFHLGGCAHCHVSRVETLQELCDNYGIEPAELLEALEGVYEEATASN